MKDQIKVGIGFATGRKHFQSVLRSYIYSWKESGLVDNKDVSLHVFVAYDLSYEDTKKSDYTSIQPDVSQFIDSKFFIGIHELEDAKQDLLQSGIVEPQVIPKIFGKGYAAQRNIILYYAIKNHMDYLLFLDDDEYPMAVTRNAETAIWSGQQVLKTHLESIKEADITYGYHCGYISPIPFIEFSDTIREEDLRLFIQAISNDIVNWETTKKVIKNGGVTYADTEILIENSVIDVAEIRRAKFISGSNLCINLTDPERVFPFYNPPGARGEDTFLSTCLRERKVLRIPCYAFHDGFSAYNHLLSGVLPTSLKAISADSKYVIRRFIAACIGWVRYKPLLLYITDQENYRKRIDEMICLLDQTLPVICKHFGTDAFLGVMKELKKYDDHVQEHYEDFTEAKKIWSAIMTSLSQ